MAIISVFSRINHMIKQEQIKTVAPTDKAEHEYWGSSAKYYDQAYEADTKLNDMPFYLDVAKSANGAVLEVGCGSGRLLIPTARAGVQIDGFDFSPDMLSILRDKLNGEAPEVRDRVSLHQGDMRDFSLGKKYSLITVPFRPLQHIFTVDDQLAAFNNFSEHLNRGGRLAFNLFYPDYKLLEETGVEHQELEWKDKNDSTLTVRRSFVRTSVDKLNQVFQGEFIFRSFRGDSFVREDRSHLSMSYYTYPQVLLLLRASGFRVLEEYGSFNKEPISVCKEMVFIAEKEK
ncbi:MAG: class I SAM-dependent methyltransferase [SAR324 cluster bacterium]|uniref:Class I SAM-dependent methyltransferase n=1 Tax=SAR324 cluster bacterium TaxID=2024889 RepID=A0A7X9IKY5_9DELT|nr:class I SAM-dependent methyltransferase [SAR324 cluster bacterium]